MTSTVITVPMEKKEKIDHLQKSKQSWEVYKLLREFSYKMAEGVSLNEEGERYVTPYADTIENYWEELDNIFLTLHEITDTGVIDMGAAWFYFSGEVSKGIGVFRDCDTMTDVFEVAEKYIRYGGID